MKTQFWNLYKNSEDGKSSIGFFEPDISEQGSLENKLDYMFQLSIKHGNNTVNIDYIDVIYNMFACNVFNLLDESDNILSREGFASFFDRLEIYEINENTVDGFPVLTDKLQIKTNDYRHKNQYMHIISTILYFDNSFFKPILYPSRFDIIERNCEALGIELPTMPHTNDYREYSLYYYDLCEAFAQFQVENNLSDAEFCACLYCFADMLCEEESRTSELPRPTNVWLTGASKYDINMISDKGIENIENQIWACNERTRRGDIVVLYALTPHSCIHSVWRANSGGMFNPFDYYHYRTTLSDGNLVPRVSNKDLKSNSYFSNVPIVKRNLQGVNGIELSGKDYEELLGLFKDASYDVSILPKLADIGCYVTPETSLEKDVEEKILIPLLKDILGYKEGDWLRQLQQKAGRGLKAIPDFVFFPSGELHLQNAPLVIEAKLDMSSSIEIRKAYRQSLSYARMMQSKIFGICDKNRLMLYQVDNNGVARFDNPIFESQWSVIYTDATICNNLQKLIGREVISQKKGL